MSRSIPELLLSRADQWHDQAALCHKQAGSYQPISWSELEAYVRRHARALLSLDISSGERVAILAANGPRWVYADLAALACGAVSVPIYHTEGVASAVHILADSCASVLFIDSAIMLEKLLHHMGEIPCLRHIVLFEGANSDPRVLSIKEYLDGAEDTPMDALNARLQTLEPETLATLVYTSGTTGAPKGVMLTHGQILAKIEACAPLFPLGPGDVCLSFLPLSHIFERVDGYYFLLSQGVTIAYAESVEKVPINLTEVRPTLMLSVPRLFEKMFARVMERVLASSWPRKQIFFAALRLARYTSRLQLAGKDPQGLLRSLAELADRGVFANLRAHLGGRLRFCVAGGAPLGDEIAEFFLAAGLVIYQGYGLTESGGGISVNTPVAHRLGSVGKAMTGTEIRIAEDGEILLRGPSIFSGYWQRPEESAQVFSDGWFLTGDVGELDQEGYLYIRDRKKDLIVTAGGENIAPQNIEHLLKADKLIANALVYGNRKPFLVALIVPNFDNLERFARTEGVPFLDRCDLVNRSRVLELLRQRIDACQRELASFQRIKRFALLSADFTSTQLTPTLKLKRNVIEEDFRAVLEQLYDASDHGVHDAGFCVLEETSNE